MIPDTHKDLLKDEKKAFAYLATMMENGTPQVTPIWFSYDGQYILLNSAAGRVKDRNMRKRPQVALSIVDPTNPYRYIQIRGKVVEFTEQGGREHINALNYKYNGNPNYVGAKDEVRIIYKVEPISVSSMG
jgi:PPOX class probable F420-dependent enzyme